MGYTSGVAGTSCVSLSGAADPGGVVAFARAAETLSCSLPGSEVRRESRGPALHRIDSCRAGPLHRQSLDQRRADVQREEVVLAA